MSDDDDDQFTAEELRYHRIVDRCADDLKAAGADPYRHSAYPVDPARSIAWLQHTARRILPTSLNLPVTGLTSGLRDTRKEIGDT